MESNGRGEIPENFEIRWEPVPSYLKPKSRRVPWNKLLEPLKAAPGSPARIITQTNRESASVMVARIKRVMEKADPYADWQFSIRAIQDTSGIIGIWAVYRGQMSQAELNEKLRMRAVRRKRWELSMEKKRIKQELEGITQPNPSRR
jgi:hypothetical protein